MQLKHHEKRREIRTRRSDALLWRHDSKDDFMMGWLLEGGQDGFAFAWRGDSPPPLGSLIDIRREISDAPAQTEQAVVRRIMQVHDDLIVVAGEIVKLRPFPPNAAKAEITPKITHTNPPPPIPFPGAPSQIARRSSR